MKEILLLSILYCALLFISCVSIPETEKESNNTETETLQAENMNTDSSSSHTDTGSSESGNKKRSGISSSYKGNPDSGKPPPVTLKTYKEKEIEMTEEDMTIFIIFFSIFFLGIYLGIFIKIIGRKRRNKELS